MIISIINLLNGKVLNKIRKRNRKVIMIKLSIILQVYSGKEYFEECLQSILPHIQLINHIYISISNSQNFDIDVKTINNFVTKNNLTNVVIYTIEKTNVSAVQHSKIFYNNILNTDRDSDFFITLCHDDILLPTFSEEVSRIILSGLLMKDVIINPARSFYRNTFNSSNWTGTYFGLLSYENLMTSKENFSKACFDRYPPTNISGLIQSKQSLKEYTSLLKLFAYGYRAEYIQMFTKPVKKIMCTLQPIIGIRNHEEQEGAKQIESALIHDEKLYITYMYYVTYNNTFRKYLKSRISYFSNNYRDLFFLYRLNFLFALKTKRFYLLVNFLIISNFILAKRIVKKILIKLKLMEQK